jgi:hypothetical protein
MSFHLNWASYPAQSSN